jgi:hypothetical protein
MAMSQEGYVTVKLFALTVVQNRRFYPLHFADKHKEHLATGTVLL